MGTEDVARQLPRPSSVAAADLLLELAGLFLAASAAAGFGITYLSGVAFNLEERVVFGSVLGAMTVALMTFVPALLVRDVTLLTVLLGLAVALATGAVGLWFGLSVLGRDWRNARDRWLAPLRTPGHPWPLVAVFVVCSAWTVHFIHQAYVYMPDGLYTGYVTIWGDWAAHPSSAVGLAFPAVLYLAAVRFTAGRAAAAIAVFVFLLSGGLGFVFLREDLQRAGLSALAHLPREYTLNRDVNLQWLNPVLAYLVPQRSTLFGFSLALIVLVVLWVALHDRLGWRPFLFAGLVAAVMPVFHVHAYGTVLALAAFWALFNRRWEWLAYFGPALLVGVPILVWMWPPDNTSVCGDLSSIHGYCIQVGWLSSGDVLKDGPFVFGAEWLWFWIWNTSLFLPLLVAAQFLLRAFPTAFPTWFSPMWLWFVIPNLIVLQPWVWDNTKFFVFWALLGSVMVGALLAAMLKRHPLTAIVAVLLMLLLGLSGALDLARASDFTVSSNQFTDEGGLKVADWVRNHTSPTAVFAVADEHNSPIPTLAGRRELIGYAGWLWTYGLADYLQKSADDKRILAGDPSALTLVRKYHVDYVMIGPQEVPRGGSRAYWEQHATLVYDDGEYAVYRVA